MQKSSMVDPRDRYEHHILSVMDEIAELICITQSLHSIGKQFSNLSTEDAFKESNDEVNCIRKLIRDLSCDLVGVIAMDRSPALVKNKVAEIHQNYSSRMQEALENAVLLSKAEIESLQGASGSPKGNFVVHTVARPLMAIFTSWQQEQLSN